MSEESVTTIADSLGGQPVRDEDKVGGEPNWLVRFERQDGRLVVLSDASVDEFSDPEALDARQCYLSISLV